MKLQIVAHRGASWARPENTFAAFDLALEEGADGMELDLQLSADDQAVVFHDKTLSMLGLKHRRIAQYSRDQLTQLDVGSWFDPTYASQRIPDLEQVLLRYADKTDLYLEIKPVMADKQPERARILAQRVAQQLLQHSQTQRIYVLSFSDAVLQEVQRAAPKLRCVHNLEFPKQLNALSEARWSQLHAVCVDIRHFNERDVEEVHTRKKALFAYTVDSARHLQHALNLGVQGVISNRPAELRERLQSLSCSKDITIKL